MLGYIPADSRLYLGDKELNVVSFQLLLSVLEYQTAVMRRDFETADKVNSIPENILIIFCYRSRVKREIQEQIYGNATTDT